MAPAAMAAAAASPNEGANGATSDQNPRSVVNYHNFKILTINILYIFLTLLYGNSRKKLENANISGDFFSQAGSTQKLWGPHFRGNIANYGIFISGHLFAIDLNCPVFLHQNGKMFSMPKGRQTPMALLANGVKY